jgi:hypothetical protein
MPHKTSRQIGLGAVVGYFSAFFAIIVANFFIPNGFDRTLHTVKMLGAFSVLATDFAMAAFLLGWLPSMFVFGIYCFLMNSNARHNQR